MPTGSTAPDVRAADPSGRAVATPARGFDADSTTVVEPPVRPRGPQSESIDEIGPYRLLETLGEGGMGVVRLGLDGEGRAVAVKVLRDHVAHDPSARARLRREFDALARVRHRLVAPVLDVDTQGPRPYLVTRYVPGPSLDDWVRERGPLTGARLGRVGRGLAEALTAIHAAGVVHRDLKPSNVLMLDGEPVVIDFGIAHLADDARLTRTGLVMGTPGYLPPELLDGESAGEATDWWGWAATLAFAATGRPPFGRGPMDAVFHRVYRGDADLDGVDPRLTALLRAALDPDPARRPGRSRVVAGLDAYASGQEATAAWGSAAPVSAPDRSGERTEVVGSRGGLDRDDAPTARIPAIVTPTRVQPVVRSPVPPPFSAEDVRAGGGHGAREAGGGRGPQARVDAPGRQGSGWRPARGDDPRASSEPVPTPYDRGFGHGGASVPPPGVAPTPLPPRRVGLPLAAGALVFFALVASWPVMAVVVGLGWCALARTVDSSVMSVRWRRQSRGIAGAGDVVRAVALSPLRLVTATLTTVLLALLAAPVVVAALFAAPLVVEVTQGATVSPLAELPLTVGAFVAAVLAWWGPGGHAVRHGSRVMVRSVTPGGSGQVVLAVGLGLVAAFLALRTQASGVTPDWAPLAAPSTWAPWSPW